VLLSFGKAHEAYRRYGLFASQGGTYLATFKAVARKYPHKSAAEVIADLVATKPDDEEKWFAAAKDAGLFEKRSPSQVARPAIQRRSLAPRATSSMSQPALAVAAGLLAL
jgi:hypothetical protein